MKLNNNKGFSLVEVIVAMTILVIVSIPMLNTFNRSMMLNNTSKERQRAISIDQSVVEGLKVYDIEEIRKNFQKEKKDFNILNGISYEKFAELRKTTAVVDGISVTSYAEAVNNVEKGDQYYYAIYGVEDGIDKYDVLVSMDADATDIDKVNEKSLPRLVNVSSMGSVVLDNSGKFYSSDSFIDEAVDNFLHINETSGAAKKTAEQILNNMQCEMDVNINNNGAAYEVYATITFSTIGTQISLDGTSKFYEYRKDNVGYTVISTGYPRNIYLIYTPISIGDEINLNYNLTDDPGKTEIAIITNNKYHGTFDFLTSGSNSSWASNVNIYANCDNSVFANMTTVGGKTGAVSDSNKRMFGVKVEVYEYAKELDNKFKTKKVSSLSSSIIN